MRELSLGNEAAPRWEPRSNPALPLGLDGSRPAHPHSHGFREALWIWPLRRCQLQGLHPSWDQEPNLGIFSWRRSLRLPGRTQRLFIPAWSNPTFLSLAQGSRSDFAKFASSVCEFSDKFWVRFWFFFPLWISGEHNKRTGGRAGEGRSGKGGFGAGNSDMDTINGPCGSCTQSALCVPHKGWVRSVCKQHRDQQIAGIMESPPGKAGKGEGLGALPQ